ncbi:MAG TPA: S1-like domain-containing RNA-binding protein [Chitinophagaceae bacterium]|nr:S1-like domain-containing RNA-binding protein [Chitinophagaceae bacterium]
MVNVGQYNILKVLRITAIGAYLDDGAEGILLPKRFVPRGLHAGEEIEVFVYHDSDNRLIATTQKPKGVVGDIVQLKVVSVTRQGAFLDWGLMKDLFVPASQQRTKMLVGGEYMVQIYLDERTGRVAATEKTEKKLSNEELTVKEMDIVDIVISRSTDIGYVVIINEKHTGMLYANELYQEVEPGQKLQGYIKKIRPDNKIDVALGKPGYQRVGDESGKIMELLRANSGYLPYNDKSTPEDIYTFFGMSKKAFKMAVGLLYKQRLVELTQTGIKLVDKN